jgi:Asp-tRNA(Asn)/Glu-tRNA(Gln) amidotransferase C subunit
MLRLRFSSGLLLGLVLGVPAGVVIGLLLLPPRGTEPGAASNLQIIELTRKLEAMQEDKERAARQLEQFATLAEQMTASFNRLELRFKALEDEQRLRDAQPTPRATAAIVVPTPTAPEAAPEGDEPPAESAHPPELPPPL